MAQSDIIIVPGDGPRASRMGKIHNAEVNFKCTVPSVAQINTEEEQLKRAWPDWDTRVLEYINLCLGPKMIAGPSRLPQITLGQIIGTVLEWAQYPKTVENLKEACHLLQCRCFPQGDGFDKPTPPVNPREIIKSTLLWILSQRALNQ